MLGTLNLYLLRVEIDRSDCKIFEILVLGFVIFVHNLKQNLNNQAIRSVQLDPGKIHAKFPVTINIQINEPFVLRLQKLFLMRLSPSY